MTAQFVTLNGVSLEIQHIPGNSQQGINAQPIVFLHEGLGSVAMWRDFPAQLCAATGRAGLVYSRRGYGQSDAVPDVRGAGRLQADYMHREAWEVLPALLAAQNIHKPVLFGHSDGATIALLYAARYACESCIVLAPHLFVEQKAIDAITQTRLAYESGDLRVRLQKFHAHVDCAFWQWNEAWLSEAFRSFNIEAECSQITSPVLAIQGQDDAYGTMAQIDRLQQQFLDKNDPQPANSLRRVLLKLEQCGHSPHRDQPTAVIEAVQRFLG